MLRIVHFLVLASILFSSLSLSVQQVYKTYWCQDTKAELSIGGRAITVCGATCSLDLKNSQSESSALTDFNQKAPPLFYEILSQKITHWTGLSDSAHHWDNQYIYLHVSTMLRPPQG